MTNATDTNLAAASGTFQLGDDLPVYRLGFGAMRITGKGIWGEPENRAECIAVLRRSLELGVNLIDTADAYGPNVSEELIAEALYPYPDGLVIATKGGLVRSGPDQWSPDGRPEHLREALEGSLRRLRLEQIDLYQFHRPDPKVPFEESVGTFADFQKEGKVRHVGLSNVTTDQLAVAQTIVPIASVQNRYNLTDREHEDVLNACEQGGHRLYTVVPSGHGQSGEARQQTRRNRASTRCGTRTDRARLAAEAIAGHAPDSRHVLRGTPRRKYGGSTYSIE